MEELIGIIKLCGILLCITVVMFIILSTIVKILTIAELISEKRAYDLIAEEEKLEIENKKTREKRESEFHKERMELLRRQQRQVDSEIRNTASQRNIPNTEYNALNTKNVSSKKFTNSNEMIKELYRKDENGKYVHSLLERNSIYGMHGNTYDNKPKR